MTKTKCLAIMVEITLAVLGEEECDKEEEVNEEKGDQNQKILFPRLWRLPNT